jgi:aldehyde:ferredoxin oxidoreductase
MMGRRVGSSRPRYLESSRRTSTHTGRNRLTIKAEKKIVKAADRDKWKAAHQKALAEIMDERVVTSPRKGGLSVYGTNVLMTLTSNMGALPTKNSMVTSFGDDAEKISGEYVKQNLLVDDPTCHACPVACGNLTRAAAGAAHRRTACPDRQGAGTHAGD